MSRFDTIRFFNRIAEKDRLDHLTNEEIVRLRDKDFDEVYERACKIISPMMANEFTDYTHEDIFPDLVQSACIGVIKAVESWTPTGGESLASWAYRLSRQEVSRELKREQRWESRHETHTFDDIFNDEDEHVLHKNDTHDEHEGAGQRAMQWQAEYSHIIQHLNKQEHCILGMLKEGYTQREIADLMQLSQPTVSRLVVNLQQKICKLDESKRSLAD